MNKEALAALVGSLLAAGCASQKPALEAELQSLPPPPENEDKPKRMKTAFCYVRSNVAERYEYVCPVCGEKTLWPTNVKFCVACCKGEETP